MIKRIVQIWSVLRRRFQAETPKIARWVRNVSLFVSGSSMAVMTALISSQATVPDWFNSIYPYLIGIPAFIAFAFQFAEQKGDKK